MIPIVLVDDCSVSCNSLQDYFLAQGGEIEIAAVFASGADALTHLTASRLALPPLVLFSHDLPDLCAMQFTTEIQACVSLPLVVYRAPDDEEIAGELFALGVLGYLLKDESLEDLMTAFRMVARGKPYLSADLARRLWAFTYFQLAEALNLNSRERNILALLGEGMKNKAIAHRLNVAEQTVKNNVTSLYKKLVVGNRIQLMLTARELGMWSKRTNYTGGERESADNFVERIGNSLRRVASPTTL